MGFSQDTQKKSSPRVKSAPTKKFPSFNGAFIPRNAGFRKCCALPSMQRGLAAHHGTEIHTPI